MVALIWASLFILQISVFHQPARNRRQADRGEQHQEHYNERTRRRPTRAGNAIGKDEPSRAERRTHPAQRRQSRQKEAAPTHGAQPAPSSRARAPPGDAVSARHDLRLPARGGAQPELPLPACGRLFPWCCAALSRAARVRHGGRRALLAGGQAPAPGPQVRGLQAVPGAAGLLPAGVGRGWGAGEAIWGVSAARPDFSLRLAAASSSQPRAAVLLGEEPSDGTALCCSGLPAELGSVRACSRLSARVCAVGPREQPGRFGAGFWNEYLRIRGIRMKRMPHAIRCIKALCFPSLVVQRRMLRLFVALLSLLCSVSSWGAELLVHWFTQFHPEKHLRSRMGCVPISVPHKLSAFWLCWCVTCRSVVRCVK